MLDRRKIRDYRGHHPWRTIGLLADWKVEFTHDLPPRRWGLTMHEEKRVLIRAGLGQAARRDAITHETGHVMRGPSSVCGQLYEEALVDRQAARLLMPSAVHIGHALAWARGDYAHAAGDLWVSERLLHVRMSTLAPKDRENLLEQLATILL